MKRLSIGLLVISLLVPIYANAQVSVSSVDAVSTTPEQPKIFWGGGIGLSFGDVQYFELWPMVGINVTPKLGTGVQLMYRYRKDTRYEQDLSTNDYGATLFGRYKVAGPLFLHAEYEYLNYEYYTNVSTGAKDRDDFGSFLAGGGVSQQAGRNVSLYALALYNFSYDEPDSPYADPWVIRFGVGVGF